ncbi:MAG: hypothetical protein FWD61_03140 [Phycisphaerales bacterium]|nr:hypothetical protein [Phycisphaerales bacterium]
MLLKCSLCVLAVLTLGACTGVNTVKLVTNAPADVAVDGMPLGPAPVTFPMPWRKVCGGINYAYRKVTVSADGKVVWEREISRMIYEKQRTGDFEDGSKYGLGRTYTIVVDVGPATQPATKP